MRGSRKFCQRGSSVDEVKDDPNIIISGPSSASQRNAILVAFRCRADDDPKLNTDLVKL